MSEVSLDSTTSAPPASGMGSAVPDDERPPACPTCNKRLVILATHSVRDEHGAYVRQQLWGCPRGHATAHRRAGVFGPITLLAELVG